MQTIRRRILAAGGALALAMLAPVRAFAAWNAAAFDAKSVGDALKAINAGAAASNDGIVIDAPQIAENGAVVPIEVTSNIPGTTSISVLIEKNPFPLAAKFDFKEGALPYVKVNAKIGETSNVRVVAEAGGKTFSAMKEVKVTIGGCGG